MRVLLTATIGFCCATGAAAQSVPDRYGPPRTEAVTVAAYSGPMLSWPSRAAAPERAEPPPAAPARVEPAPAPAVTPQTPVAPRPANLYDTPGPQAAAQPAPARLASASATGAPTRFYSLHREYGMTPDPTPAQTSAPRYVLIGPPDGAASAPQRDADADSSSRPF